MANLWMDMGRKTHSGGASAGLISAALSSSPSTVDGIVTDVAPGKDGSLPDGWVEVGFPASDPTSYGVGQAAAGLSWVGAHVTVILDSGGRVVQVQSPLGDPNDSVAVAAMGYVGRQIVSAMDTAKAALAAGEKVEAAANTAQASADKAAADLLAEKAAVDAAASAAVTAKAAADKAEADALGAQATADSANAKASTADGRYTVSATNPNASDGAGKPSGAIWEVRSGSTSLRRYVWDGSTWTQIKAGQDFIGAKAIGTAQIGDAAIGTAQIADAAVTNAKIGDLSVSKLTVSGGATMPTAVIDNLVSQSAFLTDVLAQKIVVAGNSTNKVGAINIEDGAVTAPKVYASEELWAKIAAFGSVTTKMLTAGNATIQGSAVVGDLYGNNLIGVTIQGGTFKLINSGTATKGTIANSNWFASPSGSDTVTVSTDSAGATGTFTINGSAGASAMCYSQSVAPATTVNSWVVSMTLNSSVAQTVWVDVMTSTGVYKTTAVSLSANTATPIVIDMGDDYQVRGYTPLRVRVSSSGTLRVTNYAEAWSVPTSSSLSIFRNASGIAQMQITDNDGNVATLATDGVTYSDGSGTVGSISWRDLIAPPVAMVQRTWDTSLPIGSWQTLIPGSAYFTLKNGMTTNGQKVVVPLTGLYRISARTKFANPTTGAKNRRAIGIVYNGGSPDDNTMVQAVNKTQAVEINSLVKLYEGDSVAIAVYHEDGATLSATYLNWSIQYVSAA